MRIEVLGLATALACAPFGANAADLVVWWEQGQAAEEDEAVREVIAAFEQDSGKRVELVLGEQEELVADLVAALEARRRIPDFLFTVVDTQPYEQWAYEGQLVDLTDAVGHFSDLFDPDALARTLLDGTTGRRGLYLLLMGCGTHHVHVWKNLFERAGFTVADGLATQRAEHRLAGSRRARRRRRLHPRAGGRRGNCADQEDPRGVTAMLRLVPKLHAAALILAPLGAQAADLVVWWYKGFYEQEDEAVREIIAAFEQESGKQVDLVQPALDEIYNEVNDALAAG
jgi:ABC-type glycerol-3-phosphate transport system substrate-binding protein